jgi:hypothetical protein
MSCAAGNPQYTRKPVKGVHQKLKHPWQERGLQRQTNAAGVNLTHLGVLMLRCSCLPLLQNQGRQLCIRCLLLALQAAQLLLQACHLSLEPLLLTLFHLLGHSQPHR